jgi:hypothetical protein
VQDVIGPREQVLGVLREISSAIERFPREYANRLQRGPPAQGDYFTACLIILVKPILVV